MPSMIGVTVVCTICIIPGLAATATTSAGLPSATTGHPDVEDIIARPWCYYCERDFDDQQVLIQHQKAKHFKCDHCNRRLNTAGGLQVHLQRLHKATLTHIDNAMESRQDVEPEAFGMMGGLLVPLGRNQLRMVSYHR